MASATKAFETKAPARLGTSVLVRVGLVVAMWGAGLAAFSVLLRVVWDAQEGWATVGLSIAAGALMYCLMAMYRMVRALAKPDIEFDLARTAQAAQTSARYLREERRRLLRAINELRFDFEMGKLSKADYETVRTGYEVQAVEVMRLLESEGGLHPEVVTLLASLGLDDHGDTRSDDPAGQEAAAAEASSTDAAAVVDESADEEDDPPRDPKLQPEPPAASAKPVDCGACNKPNDPDASFCKHCGEGLGR